MGLNDLIKVESEKERKSRQEKYNSLVFPLGEKQREYEEQLLGKIITSNIDPKQQLFIMLVSREAQLAENTSYYQAKMKDWFKSAFTRSLSETDQARISIIAREHMKKGSLDELLKPEEVEEMVEAELKFLEEFRPVKKWWQLWK